MVPSPVRKPSGGSRLHGGGGGDRRPAWAAAALLSTALCAAATAYLSATSLDAQANSLLVLYFQPFLPPLVMLWLWSLNIRYFERKQVDYDLCFGPRERKFLPSHAALQSLALAFSAALSALAAAFAWGAATRRALGLCALLPPLALLAVAALLALPADVLHRGSRLFFLSTLRRVLLPVQNMLWSDFLLADVLCSLSKSAADLARAVCTMAAGPILKGLAASPSSSSLGPAPLAEPPLCSPLSPLVLSALCLPYAVRFVQCMQAFHHSGSVPQLLNACKYLASVPALILSSVEHEDHVHNWHFIYQRLWIGVMVFNSLFSFYWDTEMDWDMPWLAQPGGRRDPLLRLLPLPALRADAMYPRRWYAAAVASNLVLRAAWVHRLIGNVEKSDALELLLACLEAWRRHQWAFVRYETELRRLYSRAAAALHDGPSQEAALPTAVAAAEAAKLVPAGGSGIDRVAATAALLDGSGTESEAAGAAAEQAVKYSS